MRFTCELDAERLRDVWFEHALEMMNRKDASINYRVSAALRMLTIAKELSDFSLEALERNVSRYDPQY